MRAQVDLGGTACPLGDDHLEPRGQVAIGGDRYAEQVGTIPQIVECVEISRRETVDDQVAATVRRAVGEAAGDAQVDAVPAHPRWPREVDMGEHGPAAALQRFQRETDPGGALPDLRRGEADHPTGAQERGQPADNGRLARVRCRPAHQKAAGRVRHSSNFRLTPAESKVAISERMRAAACTIGTARAAPLPSPSRKPMSMSGVSWTCSRAAVAAGSDDRWPAIK